MKSKLQMTCTALALILLLWACSSEAPAPAPEEAPAIEAESPAAEEEAAEEVQAETEPAPPAEPAPQVETVVPPVVEEVATQVQEEVAEVVTPTTEIAAPPAIEVPQAPPVRRWFRLAEVEEFSLAAVAQLEAGQTQAAAGIMGEVVRFIPRLGEDYPDGAENIPADVRELMESLERLAVEIVESEFDEAALQERVPQIPALIAQLYEASNTAPGI